MDTPTPETIFQRYNRDEILAGIQCSSDWTHPSEVLSNLIDHDPNTKWICYY